MRSNDKLKNAVVYLAGPIDNATDLGRGWRQEITHKIKQSNIQLKVLDPTQKPHDAMSETSEEQIKIRQLKQTGQWDALVKFMKRLRRTDLRFVDLSDFIILYLDPTVHMVGSYNEMFVAEQQQKPILAIVNGTKADLSSWLFATLKPSEIFESVDECVAYLRCINDGTIELDDRWLLIRDYLNQEPTAMDMETFYKNVYQPAKFLDECRNINGAE
ncbi:MAG: hypothetical protein WC942_08620 [Clostridia bacterium]|jgi:hypothetical protein